MGVMPDPAPSTEAETPPAARRRVPDLWSLVQSRGWIDEADVIPAMRRTLAEEEPGDYRTELLIHQALNYLQDRIGADVLRPQLRPHELARLDHFERECDRGFWSIPGRLMQPTTPDTIRKFLARTRRPHPPTGLDPASAARVRSS